MNNNVECIKYLLQENCQKFPFNEDCRERGGTTTRTEWVKINSESAVLSYYTYSRGIQNCTYFPIIIGHVMYCNVIAIVRDYYAVKL